MRQPFPPNPQTINAKGLEWSKIKKISHLPFYHLLCLWPALNNNTKEADVLSANGYLKDLVYVHQQCCFYTSENKGLFWSTSVNLITLNLLTARVHAEKKGNVAQFSLFHYLCQLCFG